MQVNTAMPSVLSVRFPENFVLFTKSLNFVNVDFISVTGASCFPGVNFTTSFFTMSLLPIFACLIGLWVYFRGKKVISRQGNTEKEVKDVSHEMFIMIDQDHSGTLDEKEYSQLLRFEQKKEKIVEMNEEKFTERLMALDRPQLLSWWRNQRVTSQALNVAVQLFLLFHTPVTRKVFEYFNCHTVEVDYAFLKQDYSMQCFASEWNSFLPYVLLIATSFTIGFPLFMGCYFYAYRSQLYSGQIQARVGFLYSNYKKGSEGWEVHEIVRKMFLTGVIIYLQHRPALQASVAVMACGISCCTLNFLQPQKNRVVFWLCQMSFLSTLFKFLSAIVLISSSTSGERDSIGSLLIILDILFFVISVACLFGTLYVSLAKINQMHRESKDRKVVPVKIVPSEGR